MDIELAYNKALDYLYSFVDYSLKKSSELAKADFNLDRMRALMKLLGNPEVKYPCLHIAGTKGKGSICAMVASALTAAGYKTGLYTSPHLLDYVERIQIDGQPISHVQLIELVEQIKPHVAAVPMLTTFEITTAMGFLHFARQKVNAAVIEVGLGGRLDATNILSPRVSVISSLSYDHMAVLGNTLTLIAGEKAGIIKPGVPVISSPQKEEALKVLERVVKELHAPFVLVGKDISYTAGEHSLVGQALSVTWKQPKKRGKNEGSKVISEKTKEGERRDETIKLHIPLLGKHQVVNAATAYAALRVSGLDVNQEAIRKGFAEVNWPCRFEIVRREPPVILDSAHNQDSFEKLAETLEEYFPERAVVLIFGSSEDKNIAGMLEALKKRLKIVLATRADHPRAVKLEEILQVAKKLGLNVKAVPSVEVALDRALELAAVDDAIILSAGSMFVTAEVKSAWKKQSLAIV
jgi:dihydrofolate synthase/folylpolyglutamate synthase